MPGYLVTQVKLLSFNSLTVQMAGRNLGCKTRALLPTANGPRSVRWTLVVVGVDIVAEPALE